MSSPGIPIGAATATPATSRHSAQRRPCALANSALLTNLHAAVRLRPGDYPVRSLTGHQNVWNVVPLSRDGPCGAMIEATTCRSFSRHVRTKRHRSRRVGLRMIGATGDRRVARPDSEGVGIGQEGVVEAKEARVDGRAVRPDGRRRRDVDDLLKVLIVLRQRSGSQSKRQLCCSHPDGRAVGFADQDAHSSSAWRPSTETRRPSRGSRSRTRRRTPGRRALAGRLRE